jgi:hypothetical protein
MMSAHARLEKHLLQAVLAVLSLVPFSAGLAGVKLGPAFFDVAATVSADSHMRYLSGLLLGIGVLVWTIIPNIEKRGEALGALTLVVAVGGLSRLYSLITVGQPNTVMTCALFVELVLTPSLYLWQRRIARGFMQPRAKTPLSPRQPMLGPVHQ